MQQRERTSEKDTTVVLEMHGACAMLEATEMNNQNSQEAHVIR